MADTTTTPATETGSLADFAFDNDQTFFGIGADGKEVDTTKEIIKAVKTEEDEIEIADAAAEAAKPEGKPKPKKPTTVVEEKEKVEEEPTFFGEKPKSEEGTTTEVESKKEQVEGDSTFYKTLVDEMKEKGIFQNIELKDDEEITEEKFIELQDAEIEARVDETFEAFFEELDEDGKAFLKFKKDGGSTEDFLANYGATLNLETLDDSDAAQRDYVITQYLSTVEKLEGEDLTDRLAWLKEQGKDKTYANKYFKLMKDADDARRETLLTSQKEAKDKREAGIKEFNETIAATAKKTDKVGEFSFTAQEQKELTGYITKPTKKVGANKYVPEFQAAIGNIFAAKTEESRQKLLLLAKLIKSDFNIEAVKVKAGTQAAAKVKTVLKDAKAGVNAKTAGSYQPKALGDFF